jgi:hypothetical protein
MLDNRCPASDRRRGVWARWEAWEASPYRLLPLIRNNSITRCTLLVLRRRYMLVVWVGLAVLGLQRALAVEDWEDMAEELELAPLLQNGRQVLVP